MKEIKLGKATRLAATSVSLSAGQVVKASVAFYGDEGPLFVIPERVMSTPEILRAAEALIAAVEEHASSVAGATLDTPAGESDLSSPRPGLLIDKSGKDEAETLQAYFGGAL